MSIWACFYRLGCGSTSNYDYAAAAAAATAAAAAAGDDAVENSEFKVAAVWWAGLVARASLLPNAAQSLMILRSVLPGSIRHPESVILFSSSRHPNSQVEVTG